MNLKVLPNDLQRHLEGSFFRFKTSKIDRDDDKLLDDIIGWETPRIPPVFNRVGFYLLDNKTAWYEFKLPSGRYVGIKYSAPTFKYQLEMHEANEKPIVDKDWEMINILVKRGVLKWDKRYDNEGQRRYLRDLGLDTKRYMIGFRQRIKDKIAERKSAKQE